jgi:hypothetical protein
MKKRTAILSAATLGVALAGGAARSADLPKEGTFTATASAAGKNTVNAALGKERWFGAWELNGLSVGSGLLDHMTWHCWGITDGMNTIGQYSGHCVLTDPAGDQIATDLVSDGKVDFTKIWGDTHTISAGTGKYAGISGGWTFTLYQSEFKTPAAGTWVQYGTLKGSYKLP